MARDPQSGSFNSKVVDEQTKAAAMRAAAASAGAAATAIAKTPEQLAIDRINAQIAKTQSSVSNLEKTATELGALNPNAMTKAPGETNAEFLSRKTAAENLARSNAMAGNPLLNKAVKPTDAPAGKYYAWIGGTNTGQWQLYDIPGYGTTGTGGGGTGGGGTGGGGTGGGGTGGGGDGATTYTAPDGKIFTDLNAYNAYIADLEQQRKTKAGQSAYDLLFEQFNQYGMGALVEPLKQFIQQGLSSSEFTLRLRDTDAYKKRFAANASRIQKGLSALNEAEYIGLEDQYQNIMREYGLPASYYARGEMGRQEGFEKFLANDVSAAELEDRVLTAQSRVLNSNPEVLQAIRDFYGDSVTDGDILAYALNPEKALTDIKRKVTAAEIGGAAMQAGLNRGRTPEERAAYAARAAELGAAGVTKKEAQEGFQAVAELAPRGGQLAEIYKQSPYTQTTAESEVFGLSGSTEAAKQRKKLTSLETAAFGGSAGAGAIARDRAGVL
jgi:NADPH-dependent ferric siderophore reductase